MRFILIFSAISFVQMAVIAQTPRVLPANHASNKPISYVRTWSAIKPETNSDNLTVNAAQKEYRMTTVYMDGLGRPIETVVKQGSLKSGSTPVVRDFVSAVEYDDYGRTSYAYLPFPAQSVSPNTSLSDGLFKLNPLPQQESFYNSYLNGQTGENPGGRTWAYQKTNYEAAPLDRPVESFAPGVGWVGSEVAGSSNNKSMKLGYFFNTSSDSVRIWNVTNAALGTFGTYSTPAAYPTGVLSKTITTDEINKQTIEFKDKQGRLILSKRQIGNNIDNNGGGSGHTGWLSTYYIYDDLGQLRCVIQPVGTILLNKNSWGASTLTGILDGLCFRYEYDSRGRMIMKKVPGADVSYMIYDLRNRLVMRQDAHLRGLSKWEVMLYDELNRPTQVGVLKNTYTVDGIANRTFQQHLAGATTLPNYPFGTTTPPATPPDPWEPVSKINYDNYSNVPAGLPTTFNNGWSAEYLSTDPITFPVTPVQSTIVKGLPTWQQVKVLETTNQFLSSVNFYDDYGRLIQTAALNLYGGVDISTTQYSFSGQPLLMIQRVQKAGASPQVTEIVTRFSYDELGRVIKTEKKLRNDQFNSNAWTAWLTISTQEYDELGNLKSKKLGSKRDPSTGNYYTTRQPVQELGFDYNVRGWMLGMNRDYLTTNNPSSNGKLFGFEIGYEKNVNSSGRNFSSAAAYNGNIRGIVWKSEGDQIRRKYDFGYDAVSRLLKGDFEQNNTGATWDNSLVNFSMKMGDGTDYASAYDDNGNILRMQQWGLKSGTIAQLDDLRYNYASMTNKLNVVLDIVNDPASTLGDFKTLASHPTYSSKNLANLATTLDYAYDASGNLVKDYNKAIGLTNSDGISYTRKSLPKDVTFRTSTASIKGVITYIYDESAQKLKKIVTENNASGVLISTTTTNYLSGLTYETKTDSDPNTVDYTDKLQFIAQEEGRIRPLYDNVSAPATITGFVYDYFIKDHLGNVRMMLTDEIKTKIYPAATLEGTYNADGTTQTASMINYENFFFKIDNSKVVDESSIATWKPSGDPETTANGRLYYNNNGNPPANINYPTGTTPIQTDGSTKLYLTNATTNKTGLEFVIKVMAGDKIDIFGKSYHTNTGTINNANSTTLDANSLMGALLNGPANPIGAKGITVGQLAGWNPVAVLGSLIRGTNGETTTIPKAYVNYLFLDENFRFVSGNGSRVGASGTVKNHWQSDVMLQNIAVPKNGYLFVYVSNESNVNVYFDNLQVIHKPGPILEETHYYPFGLAMAGISSKALALGGATNKYKFGGKEFNNQEFSDGAGIETYDFGARNYDPQIGQWHTVDPLCEISRKWSPYNYAYNNPIRFVDPDGMKVVETEDRITYTGDDAIAAFSELKTAYGKSDRSDNSLEEEPDSKSNTEKSKNSEKASQDPFLKIFNQADNEAQAEVNSVISRQAHQDNGGGPPYYYNGERYESKSELYFGILLNKAADQFGILDIAAFGAVLSGQAFLETRGKFGGATKGTSVASKYLSKIPGTSPVRLPSITGTSLKTLKVAFTNNIGRFLGRAVPIFGWAVLVYDIGATFVRTQIEYNKIVGDD